jgi:hypothetical protein
VKFIIIIIIIVIIIKIGRCLTLCCFVAHVLVVVSFVMSLLKKHWLVYRGGSNKAERAASAYYRYKRWLCALLLPAFNLLALVNE